MTLARRFPKVYFSRSSIRPLWKVLFYGSDNFSLKTLTLLNENRLKRTSHPQVVHSLAVVCPKFKSPVRDYAAQESLPFNEWPCSIPRDTFDLGVVVSFGHMIPAADIEACKYGMINVHPSLLPRWRGAAPLVHTLLAGDTTSGVSVITVAPKRFDTGKIVAQQEVSVPPRVHLAAYTDMMADIGASMLLSCLQDLPLLLSQAREQSSEGMTKAAKVTQSMGAICWDSHTSEHIDRLYRALGNFATLTTFWKGAKVKLFDMVDPEEVASAKLDQLVKGRAIRPGYCYYHARRRILCFKCKDGWVAFRKVSLKGHKKMTATEFDCGFLNKVPPQEHFFAKEDSPE
ncbi:unnamed protein product [Ixodes persulcatus]